MQLNSPTSYNIYEAWQLPACQNMDKGLMTYTHMSVAANTYIFQLTLHLTGGKSTPSLKI